MDQALTRPVIVPEGPIEAPGLAGLLEARPVWSGLSRASDALGLADRVLLHAGPPIRDRATMAEPIRNSAIMAILFEGWAADVDRARALLTTDRIRLEPAQDHHCVVPLADVLSPSMVVQVVENRADRARRAFAPLNGGVGPVMRVGQLGAPILERLRWLNGPFADALGAAMLPEIDLLEIADASLIEGDDCHGRTPAATARIASLIGDRVAATPAGAGPRRFLGESPPFFLNLWMAAVKCAMRAAAGAQGSDVVVAAGGNGVEVGLQVAGLPGRWFVAPATPPVLPAATGETRALALGAIGDSAVVDSFGTGAMALAFAPETRAALGGILPSDWQTLPARLLAAPHPAMRRSGACAGLRASRAVETGETPLISLGVLDRTGQDGRIGGGLYRPPLSLYRDAVAALANS
jgi:hypothetical protein